jgi:hypothetical protein
MKITFNTSRLYTDRGQVITAEFDGETGKVWFNDHSRMVDGGFTVKVGRSAIMGEWEANPEAFARCVMRHYDAGGTHDIPYEDYILSRELREGDTILKYRI